MKHIFHLSDDVFETLTEDEVIASVNAMKTVGCYRLPYESDVYVRISPKACAALLGMRRDGPDIGQERWLYEFPLSGPGTVLNIMSTTPDFTPDLSKIAANADKGAHWDVRSRTLTTPSSTLTAEQAREGGLIDLLQHALVVVLAARGYRRQEFGHQTKLQKLQGKNKNGEIITYIDLGARPERNDLGGTHASPRLHLRRAHVREQPYPAKGEIKPILIAATLVSADAEFMVTRKAYVVRSKFDPALKNPTNTA